MEINHVADYAGRRADAYPEIGEQLDAMWKILARLDVDDPELADMLQRIDAIKEKYPKPR
ncbi:hypothetical protein [Chromobacterium violaceum]|uniref:hypothetical protein n=1 Tax=Chromobacterium violaceum TaxID=536 RepID=UPI003DA9D882